MNYFMEVPVSDIGALPAILTWLWSFMNSSFVVGFFGAGFGAYAATHYASKKDKQKLTQAEISNINTAITHCMSMINTLTGFKVDCVVGVIDAYMSSREELLVYQETHPRKRKAQFDFKFDFNSFERPFTPISSFQDLIYNKLALEGRELIFTGNLVQSMSLLIKAIESRNVYIEEWKKREGVSEQDKLTAYFGIKTEDGHLDGTYRGLLVSIKTHVDDCLFYSNALIGDLGAYGKYVIELNKVTNRKVLVKDTVEGKWGEIIPSDDGYQDWLAFKSTVQFKEELSK